MSNFMYTANGSVKSNKQRIIEGMADSGTQQKLPTDFFNLAGNLKLAGSVRATNFYKEDGSELQSVVKLGLPENVFYVEKKLGINQDKPTADLDVKGTARVSGDVGIDGSMGLSGNLVGKGTGVFAGRVLAEDELLVGKNAGVGGNLGVGGNFGVSGNFGTQGTSTFRGLVTAEDDFVARKNAGIGGNLGVSGNFGSRGTGTFGGLVTAEDEFIARKNAGIGGNLGVGGNFGARGTGTFGGLVTAEDEFVARKNAGIGGNLGVGGNFGSRGTGTFGGLVTAEDEFIARKNASIGGNLGVQGPSTFRGLVTAEDELVVAKNAGVRGNLGVGGNFGTQGTATFKGKVTAEDELIGKSAVFAGRLNMGDAILLGGQNVPHPDVGDGAFYRADGQVQIATDDLIRLRHVGSKATGIQFDVREGAGDIQNPNGQMKISRQGIMFGGPNAEREGNSGQISAGLHIPNSLNIVGMSANKNAASRRIDMWTEGGLNVYGPTNISGDLNANSGRITVKNDGSDWKDINLQGKCGQWHMSGPRCTENADFGIWYNPEPWSNKWQEQIRLSAKDGKFKVPATSQICIGDTCVTEAQFKQLVSGSVGASDRKQDHMYYPEDAIIYQNPFDALEKGAIAKSGNPAGWNDSSFKGQLWNGRNLLHIGTKNAHPNGLLVRVPEGKTVLWIRVLNGDRWESFQVYTKDGKDLGNFTSGFRQLTKYCPDGSLSDSFWNFHTWMPVPVPGPGEYIVCGGNRKNDAGNDCWISGIAFSTNPWNHAMNSAVAYHWLVNEGSPSPTWNSQNWNNDQLAQLDQNQVYTLMVPVINSGKDKLLYIIEHNNNWDGASHTSVTVNDKPVERLRSTYSNPFARHYNSKIYNRFLALRIPKDIVGNNRFMKVVIDMRNLSQNIFFREIGTVDYN